TELAAHLDGLLAVRGGRAKIAREVIDDRANASALDRRRSVAGEEQLGLFEALEGGRPVAERGGRLCEGEGHAVLFLVVALALGAEHDASQLVESLRGALEVTLAGRELDLGDQHRLEELLVGAGDLPS